MPFEPGGLVQLPAATWAHCAWRPRCTPSASGRSVSRHPAEALLHEWRARQQTPQGRATLRERVAKDNIFLVYCVYSTPVRYTLI